MRSINPIGAAALLSLIPIIILYMLKPTHIVKEVPSNYLWGSLTEQLTERAKLDKLKRQLLFWLDIAIAICIALMLMQFIFGAQQSGMSHVIIVDGSFSMQATDASPTRLDAAKQRAKQYIDTLPNDAKVTLMHLTDAPKIYVKDSDNKGQLTRAIDLLTQSQRYWSPSDVAAALQALDLPEDHHIVYFGDKTLPYGENIRVDVQNDNLSIDKMASQLSGTMQNVMASVHNYANSAQRVEVSFYDGDLYVETQIKTIPAGETSAVFFSPIAPTHGVLKAQIDNQDMLKADNVYYHVVKGDTRPSIAYFGAGNAFIDKYLSLKDCDVTKSDLDVDTPTGYDLYIFDGALPEALPSDGNIIAIDPQQHIDALGIERLGTIEFPIFTRDTHEVNTFLQDEIFHIGASQVYALPADAAPIFSVPQGALALSYQRGSQKIMVFGFDFRYTDLPLDVQFPIMMNNVYTMMTTTEATRQFHYQHGDDVDIVALPQTETIVIQKPDGASQQLAADARVVFADTDQYGAYQIEQFNQSNAPIHTSTFVINPPSIPESQMVEMTNDNHQDIPISGTPLTPFLGYSVLCLLAVELWIRLKK